MRWKKKDKQLKGRKPFNKKKAESYADILISDYKYNLAHC